ncbi:MAG TPA: glycoside hydrolase family 2 TIM barrel-domain containing protein [Candidatus Kapabacteria bacterium]|nr:glycoside hydrolase family 2 TIM barrel-domain containing protein [Candidatus Kapabacteria bacterium]
MYKNIQLALILLSFLFINTFINAKNLSQNEIKTILNTDTRQIISLNGQWEKSSDGVRWENVHIPYSDVNLEKITLVRKVRIDKSQQESLSWQLFFLGFNHQAEIAVNGQFLGRFISSMAPIWVKIPSKALEAGENEIRITFLVPKDIIKTVFENYVYARKRYNGLVREAFLIGNPPVWISDINTNYTLSNNFSQANINATISVSSSNFDLISKFQSSSIDNLELKNKANFQIETKIVKLGTGEIVAIGEPRQISIEAERTIDVNVKFSIMSPSLWLPDNPNLYQIQAMIVQGERTVDNFATNFGLREIAVSRAEKSFFTLNGYKIPLKAVSYIDYHIASGQSLSLWRMEENIRMIKMLGANAIRFKFNPPHPYFAYLCDKYGLLMLLDLPLYAIPNKLLDRDEVKVYIKNQSKLLTYFKQNYASTFAFGFSDGICEANFPNEFASDIKSIVTSNGNYLFYKFINSDEKVVNSDNFDFIGINLKKENSILRQASVLREIVQRNNNKPFITCFGVPVNENNHNGYSDPYSNEHQAFYIKSLYNLSFQNGSFGVVVNSFNDYELNHPYLATNNYHSWILTTGVTDATNKPRFSYSMLQALFNDEKEPLINAGSYAGETLVSFLIFGFILLVVLLFFINRFRRFREYLTRAMLRPYNFYSDIRDQRIIPSFQTVILALIVSFTIGMYVTSLLFYYRNYDITQFLIMLCCPSSFWQEIIYKMIWMPEVSLFIIALISFIVLFAISIIIKIFAFFSRARIYFSDCLIISVWASAPFVVLLPVAIPLIRLLEINNTVAIVAVILFLIIKIWVIARILKATAVVFDKPAALIYGIGIIVFLVFAAIPVGIYQINYQFFSYLMYFCCAYL